MIDPVNVIAPIAAPSDISIRLAIFILPGVPKLKISGFKNADIATNTAAQSKYKIIVVPTIIVFNHGEEVKRYQANIMMQIEAKLEDVQDLVDETVMESF